MLFDTTQAELFLSMLDNMSSPTLDADDFAEENAIDCQYEPLGAGQLLIRAKFRDGSRVTVTIVDDVIEHYDFMDGSW